MKPSKQQRKAARMLAHGASIMDALTGAGYSPAQARKGMARVTKSRGLVQAIHEEMQKYPPEVRRELVRLRLVTNVIKGEDVATKSARLLGMDRQVNLWKDEQGDQVVVIQAPAGWNPRPLSEHSNKPLPPVSEQPFPDYEGVGRCNDAPQPSDETKDLDDLPQFLRVLIGKKS